MGVALCRSALVWTLLTSTTLTISPPKHQIDGVGTPQASDGSNDASN